MRLDGKVPLFIGLKIDSKLREALATASPGDKKYFDDPTGQFLRVLNHNEDSWIGKVFDGAIPPSEIEDIGRNVISILNRIASGTRHSPSMMRIFATDPSPAPMTPIISRAERDRDRDRD
jgi:hypothetical protein